MKPVIVIAEAGINHNGSMDRAKELIDVAAEAGCNFVKFQTFKTELVISKNSIKAEYQIRNAEDKTESQFDMAKKFELSFDQFLELERYCRMKKIGFLSTGFDHLSIDFLGNMDIPYFKIPSGEITNKPYLQKIASKGKPVLISTGMATLEEVHQAIYVLKEEGLKSTELTILHCNTEYPTPMEDVNLLAMVTMRKEFGVEIGYSDHTAGIEVPVAAVALGATVIEKHFTTDRSLPGPDHAASLEPLELRDMVKAIRNIEMAIGGDGIKKPSASEMKNKLVARRSIHLRLPAREGEVITMNHLIMKRPGTGISPMLVDQVIGKKFRTSVEAEKMLTWDQIEY